MTEFLLALGAFLLAHAIPPAPPVRARLIGWLGRPAYLTLYSLLSLVLIVWVISAGMRAPHLPLWSPAAWQAAIPILVMPVSMWLLIAGLVEPNPLSLSIRKADDSAEPGPMASVARHPVLWAFLLWALAHIPATGHVVALTLFGGMGLLSLAGMFALDRRAVKRFGKERWEALAAEAPLIPFVGLVRNPARLVGIKAWPLAAAFLVYLWFLLDGHRRLIGPDPLAWF